MLWNTMQSPAREIPQSAPFPQQTFKYLTKPQKKKQIFD